MTMKDDAIRDDAMRDVDFGIGSMQGIGTVVDHRRGDCLFHQGDPGDTVLYLERGSVRLSLMSNSGKEAIVATPAAGEFVGDEVLAGRSVRLGTATASTASRVRTIPKADMLHLLRTDRAVSDRFIGQMLTRTIRLEADLADQVMN